MTLKVSCVHIAGSSALDRKRALAAFAAQSYPHKQLVIVGDYREDWTEAEGDLIRRMEVIKCPVPNPFSTGNVVRTVLDFADGDIICNWGRDCWYHSRRIELQLAHLIGSRKMVSCAVFSLLFDLSQSRLYMSARHLWPKAMLCTRSYLADNPEVFMTESVPLDSVAAQFRPFQRAIAPHAYAFLCVHAIDGRAGGRASELLRASQALSSEHSVAAARIFHAPVDFSGGAMALERSDLISRLPYTLSRGNTLL